MRTTAIVCAVAAALMSLPVYTQAADSGDIAELRRQLAGLVQRVERLERENTFLKSENERRQADDEYLKSETRGLRKEAATHASEVGKVKGADWAGRVTVKGDVRYRHERISDDQSGTGAAPDRTRDRHRIRARVGIEAKVTDTIVAAVQVSTTEGGDPRSSNQTLAGENSRKALDIDLGYVDWKFASWGNFTAGKMRYPFVRPGQSPFYDNDINPEGLALGFSHGIWFGSLYGFWLEERHNMANTTTAAATTCTPAATATTRPCSNDTTYAGAQLGARIPFGASTLMAAVSYSDLAAGQYYRPFYNNSSNGNTLIGSGNTGSLAFDFEIIELAAEFNTTLGALPLQVWLDVAENQGTDDLNRAWGAGVVFGRASNYRTWEFGAGYQVLEKDSLFAQFIESDFGNGQTDTKGWMVRAGFAPVRNWVLNATYFLNKRNIDVPAATFGLETDYDRLQLDFNVRF